MKQDGSKADTDTDAELARQAARVHHLLRQLPPRPAPASLARRVRAALGAQPCIPWHRRPWSHWPAPARVLSALGLAGSVAAGAEFLAAGWRAASGVTAVLAVRPWPDSWDLGEAGRHALRQAAQGMPTPAWIAAGALGLLMSAMLAGLGAAAWRMVDSEAE